jgi:hypothetical protein
MDASVIPDGGALDAGFADANVSDAGIDAGGADAGSDAGLVDAGPIDGGWDGGIACSNIPDASVFPTFDRTCRTDSDCTIGMHLINCCGAQVALGLASSQAAAFAGAEAICDPMYGGCGCFSGNVTADDGEMAPGGSGASAILVHCNAGKCETSVRPSTTCDTAECTPTQVCVQECSGVRLPPDAGPLPSVCVDVPPACATSSDCSCFGTTDPCPTGSCQSVTHGAPLCLCE